MPGVKNNFPNGPESHSMDKTSAVKILLCVFSLVLAGWLQGCTTDSEFSYSKEPENGKGLVYLYRTSTFSGIAQSFRVEVSGRDAGRLHNASYLALQLPPGVHSLTIAPGGLSRGSSRDIEVRAGTTTYYEYDFVAGLLSDSLSTGVAIKRRDPSRALADLKNLENTPAQARMDSSFSNTYARIDNAGEPNINAWGHAE